MVVPRNIEQFILNHGLEILLEMPWQEIPVIFQATYVLGNILEKGYPH